VPGLLVPRKHDADPVLDVRPPARGDRDRAYLRRHRARVGGVDETGVGLVERDLGQNLAHVGLAADDVAQHGVELELLQHLERVVANRDALGGDHDLHALPLQVADGLDALPICPRNDHHERVPREDHRLRAEAVAVAGRGQLHVRGSEDVRRGALADLAASAFEPANEKRAFGAIFGNAS
jgi:hypothetical protein